MAQVPVLCAAFHKRLRSLHVAGQSAPSCARMALERGRALIDVITR